MKPGGGAWQGAIAAQQAKKTKVVRFEVSHSPTKIKSGKSVRTRFRGAWTRDGKFHDLD